MKIKVITFNNTVNYGAVLQAVALQRFLINQGHDTELINYVNKHEGLKERSFYLKIRSKLWSFFKDFFGAKKRMNKTIEFFNRNIVLTKEYHKYEDLKKDYDANSYYIVGSDQVWNPNIVGSDKSFTLSFVKDTNKKISYAASFGINDLPQNSIKFFKKELSNFDKISVREKQGEVILNNLFANKSVEVVLDPTLLLDKEEWSKLCVSSYNIQDKYILCYYMPGNNEVNKAIKILSKKLSKKFGYKVINIGKKEFSKLNFFETNLVDIGPDDFIKLFLNAEIIITNSFHGTAFSINFNKQFYAVIEDENHKGKSLSSRLKNLISLVSLEQQLMTPSNINAIKELNIIDYKNVNIKLDSLKDLSKSFLLDSLK